MSKSKGNVVSPRRDRRALRRRHRARLHPLHRAARPGRRLVRRGRRGRAPLPRRLWRLGAEAAGADRPTSRSPTSSRRRRPRAAAQGALGDRQGHARHGRALRLQHGDRRGHGADQRDLAPARRAPRPARCASRWRPPLAALPVRAARRGRRLRPADRATACGRSRGRPPTRRYLERDTYELVVPGQRQGARPRRRRRRTPRARSSRRWPRARRTCRRTSTATRSSRSIVVPGKLVNVVVR